MKTNIKSAVFSKTLACALGLLVIAVVCVAAQAGHQNGKPAGAAPTSRPEDKSITAIDILLLPDATMMQHAQAVNDRLRKVFPEGFALDASHHPHVTLVQRFVLTENLDKVYAAVGKVFESSDVTALK